MDGQSEKWPRYIWEYSKQLYKWDIELLNEIMQKSSFLWVHCSFVNVESILSLESLLTLMTSVEEQPREVDCLKVMLHFWRKFGLKSVTKSTMELLDVLVTDNILR